MKNFFLFFTVFCALLLIGPVVRALNGLAFNNFNDRLGAFIFFSIGFLFCVGLFVCPTKPMPHVFDYKLTKWILALAVLLLIAPDIIGYFVPTQSSVPIPEPRPFSTRVQGDSNGDKSGSVPIPEPHPFSTPKSRVQCMICGGTGTVYCTTCNGTGETYEYKSKIIFTPLQPGESSMMKISKMCIVCHGTGQKMCIYCMGKGYRE